MSEIVKLAQEPQQEEAPLTERELREYRIYMRLRQPPMAPSAAAQFFALFLNGQSCEEIHRLNPNGFSLGAIVRARIEGDWDSRRREHQEQLLAKAREKVQQITLETVERIANELAASNKLANDRILKYLQTGDENELGSDTSIGSIKHLKEMVEMLTKLTGQDKKSQVSGVIEHKHVLEQQGQGLPALPVGQPVAPQIAAQALDAVHKRRGGR